VVVYPSKGKNNLANEEEDAEDDSTQTDTKHTAEKRKLFEFGTRKNVMFGKYRKRDSSVTCREGILQ